MKIDENENYGTAGLLFRIFSSPEARILDQARIVGNIEQTVSMLSESANLTFKTTKRVVDKFVQLGLMVSTRKVGNAHVYRFKVEDKLLGLLQWLDNSVMILSPSDLVN